MGYVGTAPLSGDYRKLDDISSGFDGSETEFTLQVGSANVTPPKETTLLISVGGILQEPVSAYTVSGSTLTFTAAPASGADFFGVMLGDTLDVGTPSDGTITAAKVENTFISGQTEITSGLAAADELLYSDGGTIKKIGLDNFVELAPTLATEDAIANGDYILFLDGSATGNMNKEAVHDLATLFAGAGMTATSSVLNVIGGDGITANANDVAITPAQTTITSLLATDIKIGEDAETVIDFETANEIHFDADNAERVKIDSTGLNIVSGSLETATIDYTDGDLAITIADGGGVTFAQDISTTDAKYIKLGGSRMATAEPASDTTGYGIVIGFDSAGSVSAGDAVYINSSGKVAQANAQVGSVTDPAIGIATNAGGSDGDDVYVLTHGIWRMDAEGLTAGDPVYVGESAGALTATVPSTDGDYVQRIGIAVSDDCILVMPSVDVIEHA